MAVPVIQAHHTVHPDQLRGLEDRDSHGDASASTAMFHIAQELQAKGKQMQALKDR